MTAPDREGDEPKRACVVYNPANTPLERIRRAVEDQARDAGWGVTGWYETSKRDSGRSAAQRALVDGASVVIVAGGDGTVRAVAEVISGTRVPIALVPSGTGNLLARALGAPVGDLTACVTAAFAGIERAVDIGVAELDDEAGDRRTHAFMVMAGIGLDAEMAQNTTAAAKKRLGWFAYVAPIARSIIANRLFHLDYSVDQGRVSSTRAHTVIVGNCGSLTGNMLLLPAAVVDDGLLDVVMMRPSGHVGWARIGTRLTVQGIAHRFSFGRRMLRRAPDIHALAYVQGRQFEARFDAPHVIELDGDGFGRVTRVRISVRPGGIVVRSARAKD